MAKRAVGMLFSNLRQAQNVSGNYKITLKTKMEQSNLLTQLTPKSYVRLGVTILLILFAGKFVINDALPYFGFDKATFGRYRILGGHLLDTFQVESSLCRLVHFSFGNHLEINL